MKKCQNRETKEWFAIKSIRKKNVNKIEVLLREIKILEEVDHPNIIKLFEVRNFISIGLFCSDGLLESELTICGVFFKLFVLGSRGCEIFASYYGIVYGRGVIRQNYCKN